VIQQNLRAKAHPYYTAYRPLQTLCLQILRMEEIKYGDNENPIYGILFDGAWLWEEYVNTLLSKKGFIHPENKLGKGAIYLFNGSCGRRYPDFYKDDMVLDAKYKRLGEVQNVAQADRDDIHQIMTYMYVQDATRGGFVVPLSHRQDTPLTSHIRGKDATVSIFGIEISQEKHTYSTFCEEMQKNEDVFLNRLIIPPL
jgi:5-methylcytosine-specific restriction endonuclease McrBC regulatory subunit McrC